MWDWGNLFNNNFHNVSLKLNKDKGTDNYEKLMTLMNILQQVIYQQINSLQAFGGSTLVIVWMNGEEVIHNINISDLEKQVKEVVVYI